MGNDNQKVEFVATFYNHYGAMCFKKRVGKGCYLAPVPRSLSSSCGTAAFFSSWKEEYKSEEIEEVYKKNDNKYIKVFQNE